MLILMLMLMLMVLLAGYAAELSWHLSERRTR